MANLLQDYFEILGLEGGMNVTKRDGGDVYYVQFRLREPGTVKRKQFMLSCRTKDHEEAKLRAAEIFTETIAQYRALRSTKSLALPIGSPEVSLAATAVALPTIKEAPVPFEDDPTIPEICELYERWMNSALPGEKRPSPETARNYGRRLTQLTERLKAPTVSVLRAKMKGLKREMLGPRMTEGNFVALLRGAAGLFWPKPMRFYREQGVRFDTPFPFLPTVPEREPFEAPSIEQIKTLIYQAETELRPKDTNCYLLFLLALGAGLRVQEATHVKWMDITQDGIRVRSDNDHTTKTKKGRRVRVGPELLSRFEEYRQNHDPFEWVIPDLRAPRAGGRRKKRSIATARRLAAWLRTKLRSLGLKNPAHWLRKVFGSVVARDYGMHAASRYLGHSTIEVTEKVYVGLLGGGPVARVI
jgi:integrase